MTFKAAEILTICEIFKKKIGQRYHWRQWKSGIFKILYKFKLLWKVQSVLQCSWHTRMVPQQSFKWKYLLLKGSGTSVDAHISSMLWSNDFARPTA